jgi:hypothetical protein
LKLFRWQWYFTLLRTCNEGKIKARRFEKVINDASVIERDTKDVLGSPDIAKTIFDKIKNAQFLFVMLLLSIKGKEQNV